MSNTGYYFWLVILVLYILSPVDAHPLFFDDLIAFVILLYLWFRHSGRRTGRGHSSCSGRGSQEHVNSSPGSLSLQDAYKLLGIDPGASLNEIKKAYREKVSKSHPDKVEHLSEELKQKAQEITLDLNNAYEIISRHKAR
ncbi:MAG TPA: hypothetical protein ENG80_02430 [Nitrospirae bacterium]|nr:DnaJ-like protein DjlA [bacterium BMS3Abin10]GBE38839.1 DnaJ-like protein DjlA [bacterium BMS3Bbin08]HDH00649.1 hypothetical protein [Nitrospirota bacterium]HDH50498.1 hypothetical protein [Nitrospirota bacterium]